MAAAADNGGPGDASPEARPTAAGRAIPVVGGRMDSRDIFIGTREVIITHGREHYRLRLTAQNKLILTK
jgi:hemin uptake protein HemP